MQILLRQQQPVLPELFLRAAHNTAEVEYVLGLVPTGTWRTGGVLPGDEWCNQPVDRLRQLMS
jgi:hypothetical protein